MSDGSFNAGSGVWTTVGQASIDPSAPGLDPGAAVIDPNAMCIAGSGITQTFPFPEAACAEQYTLSLQAKLDCAGGGPGCFGNNFLAIGVNDSWNFISVPVNFGSGPFSPQTLCLGSAGLGGSASLFLGPSGTPFICPQDPFQELTMQLDQVVIAPDTGGMCPPYGIVKNGDFEAGAADWVLTAGNGTADIPQGAGSGGSRGGHIATTKFCSDPTLAGVMSIPSEALTPSPALRIWSKGSMNAVGKLSIAGREITYLKGDGAEHVQSVCIPRSLQGTVQPVTFNFLSQTAGQVCANANVQDFVIDDLAFVSEPACAAGAPLFDNGFEQVSLATPAAPAWSPRAYKDQSATATFDVNAANAHMGNVAGKLTVTNPCTSASFFQAVTIPKKNAMGGPALRFFYKSSFNITHATVAVALNALTANVSVTPSSGNWKSAFACLDSRLGGRPGELTFTINGGSGTCATAYAAETFWIDDVSLTNDPMCP